MARLKTPGSKRTPPDIGLFMECEDEDLSPSQKDFYNKAKKDNQSFKKKMDDYLFKMKGETILEEGDCFLFQIKHSGEGTQPTNRSSAVKDIENKSAVANKTPGKPQSLGGRSTSNTPTPIAPAPVKNPGTRGRPRGRPPLVPHQAPVIEQRGTRSSRSATVPVSPQPAVVTPPSPAPTTYVSRKNAKPLPVQEKPMEATSLGGLLVGSKNTGKTTLIIPGDGDVDSKEVVIGKTAGKTYPSLTIFSRPNLQLKPSLVIQGQTERANLDVQVKGVLMYTATKFTEWLIQQGLVRSEQHCKVHVAPNGTPVLLKLGMYSDVTKFPYSGGYVWISDCCPSQFVSVFYGSIFEGAPHVPNVIIKLMYHWACQTNVPNVIQWVKVDSLYIKNIYTLLRSVCVLSVHNKYGVIGGRGKKVQIGVISLGTTSQDGATRLVKVEVMGVMETDTKKIRLRAVDPEGKQGKRRLLRILQALPAWVDKESTILTDMSVDINALNNLGYTRVEQGAIDCNKDVMEYLRKVVPRLFQNTLSLLSRPIIQQFLDELVWRERWGPIAAHAFNNLMVHLADLTRDETEESLLKRLGAAAADPFSLPSLAVNAITPKESSQPKVPEEGGKRGRKRAAEPEVAATPSPPKKATRNSASKEKEKAQAQKMPSSEAKESFWKVQQSDSSISAEVETFLAGNGKVAIDSFYYGTLPGDDSKIIDRKPAEVVSIKCCICLKPFLDNLALMKHLLLHCQIKPLVTGPLRKVHQCSQCFLGFSTAAALRGHVSDVHIPPEQVKHLVCRICDKLFEDRSQLIYHMHRTHVASELPYACQGCGHRSSTYNAIIEHIFQAHRGGQHIFCPHCLKAVGLFRNNVPLPANVVFYVNHVQRHQRQLDAQCHRCRLSFVSTVLLQRHLEQDHSSFSYNKDVRPFTAISGVLMPQPGNLIKPTLLPRMGKPSRKQGIYSVTPFSPGIKLVDEDSGLSCAECEGNLTSPDHFVGVIRCNFCKFTSCCELAVAEHYAIYHDKNSPATFSPGKPVVQTITMYCPCGFFSSSTNTVAKHLIRCENPTAYPTESMARASLQVTRRSGKKDGEEPTMLNMLGLIRKSPEPTSELVSEAEEIIEEIVQVSHSKETEVVSSKKELVEMEATKTLNKSSVIEIEPSVAADISSSHQLMDVDAAVEVSPSKVAVEGEDKSGKTCAVKDVSDPPALSTKDVPEDTHDPKDVQPSDIKTNLSASHSTEPMKISEKETTGSLIDELEDIINTAEPTEDAPDFISDLIDPEDVKTGAP